MYATITMGIELNDEPTPEYNNYINHEYELHEKAKQILKSKLATIAINFTRTKQLDEINEFTRWCGVHINKKQEPTYHTLAKNDAKMLVTGYFMNEIIEQLVENGEASSDYNNDYDNGDGIFHEEIVDKDYSPSEAIELLNDLYEYEEEDSGLWEGQGWEQILATKAAFTYGNAVGDEWNDLINEINEIDIEMIRIETANEITNKHKWAHETIPNDELYEFVEMSFGKEATELLKKKLINEIKEICK
jgi:hypothetical protein